MEQIEKLKNLLGELRECNCGTKQAVINQAGWIPYHSKCCPCSIVAEALDLIKLIELEFLEKEIDNL